ncbi:MAG: hypothetical protein LBE08_10015 [Bifidobacteriaceae bacterium]|nr:hypothetical protein [Bifidobacteriaceae bacterium]
MPTAVPAIQPNGFATMMASAESRRAYLNTTYAILGGPPNQETDELADLLDRARLPYFLDYDPTLGRPSLLILQERQRFVGSSEIKRHIAECSR